MANVEEKVESLILDKIDALGYILYDVEYEKIAKDYFLRVFIDKDSGIDLEDCEKVSKEIDDLIEQADIIKEQYFLEVSSTGVERKLTKDWHLEQNIGKEVEVKCFKPIEEVKSKEILGILKNSSKENIEIQVDTSIFNIERKNISLIKTTYNWDGKEG